MAYTGTQTLDGKKVTLTINSSVPEGVVLDDIQGAYISGVNSNGATLRLEDGGGGIDALVLSFLDREFWFFGWDGGNVVEAGFNNDASHGFTEAFFAGIEIENVSEEPTEIVWPEFPIENFVDCPQDEGAFLPFFQEQPWLLATPEIVSQKESWESEANQFEKRRKFQTLFLNSRSLLETMGVVAPPVGVVEEIGAKWEDGDAVSFITEMTYYREKFIQGDWNPPEPQDQGWHSFLFAFKLPKFKAPLGEANLAIRAWARTNEVGEDTPFDEAKQKTAYIDSAASINTNGVPIGWGWTEVSIPPTFVLGNNILFQYQLWAIGQGGIGKNKIKKLVTRFTPWSSVKEVPTS